MIQAPFDKYKVGFKRLTTTNMIQGVLAEATFVFSIRTGKNG